MVPKSLVLTPRYGNAPDFHRGWAGQNEEKLLGLAVEVTHLGGAGRHAFLNYAQVRLLHQMPTSQLPPQI
jgi:hypothetical protein